MEQTRLSEFDSSKNDLEDWDFEGVDTGYLTHGLHPYPARMIPQIARRLILQYSHENDFVWDPFCGSGTSLVESMLLGRRSVGTDLNPFAVFLSLVKTRIINRDVLRPAARQIEQAIRRMDESINPTIPMMHNINYWFNHDVQLELGRIRTVIDHVEDEDIRNFFKVCLANTVRDVSNLKKNEFKIVRMKPELLRVFKPNVRESFVKHLWRCVPLMESFASYFKNRVIWMPDVYEVDNRTVSLDPLTVDLVVTSPPYGDSSTTVAYGQFSRYPALWIGLDLDSVKAVDRVTLGGRLRPILRDLHSPTLEQIYDIVHERSPKRARQMYIFFEDLQESLDSIHRVLKYGGHACIVIGNRMVSRTRIPTDIIIKELGASLGLQHVKTIPRKIPTKRMPWQNAPENIEGSLADTMHRESIVVLKRV